jgi:hypothetical protein
MNDKNLLGRAIALVLLLGAAYGVRAIARGRFDCAIGDAASCVMGVPAAAPAPVVDEKAAPVEKTGADVEPGEDEDSKLEKKAPVVPPPAPQ